MIKFMCRFFLVLIISLYCGTVTAQQYILNGSAVKENCYCYTLTQDGIIFQNGSVWNATKIDLNNAFDYSFNVKLGCRDVDGADGIVFMLQPISTSIGTAGEGMGFEGVSPSIGIALDTYQNSNRNDPPYDHISIQANGVIDHNFDLAGPVQISASGDNVENCFFLTMRITWDPVTQWLRVYFEGNLRLEKQIDLINTIFNGDPFVYWGFSAATGGLTNEQVFCTALNPGFSITNLGIETCANIPISFQDESTSFGPVQSYFWDFGDGTTSNLPNPVHTYTAPGVYTVNYTITGFDGCVSTPLTRQVTVGDKPIASFSAFDTCTNKPVRIINNSQQVFDPIAKYTWYLNGVELLTNDQNPAITLTQTGNNTIEMFATSEQGCASGLVSQNVNGLPTPVIDASFSDGCIGELISFTSSQLDNNTTINNWEWTINGLQQTGAAVQQIFSTGGFFPVNLEATATNGCATSIAKNPLLINEIDAFAGKDTVVVKDSEFQLNPSATQIGTEILTYSWSPVNFLNNSLLKNPTAKLSDDERFYLTVTSANGCKDTSSVFVTVFKGSSVYLPTAFTPNNDGLNDILKPYLIGIKSLIYFRIFNRYGQEVYSAKNSTDGWDGKYNGVVQDGSFVWLLSAIDFIGKIYVQKGTVTIIR